MIALSTMLADGPLSQTAAGLLTWVGAGVVQGSVLALLTWLLVRYPLRRAHPTLHGALWLIVLVKFIVPVGPAMPYSLADGLSRLTGIVRPPAPAASCDVAQTVTVVPIWHEAGDTPVAACAAVTSNPPVAAATPGLSWTLMLAGAYLGIVLIAAGRRLLNYARFAARCRRLPLADAATRSLVARVCERLEVRTPPVARLSDEARAPFIFGVLAPTLVLSRRQLADAGELEAVILHEMAHIRRGDLLVRYVQWLVGTVLFFWPVVAWVNRRIDLAREYACDEWALRHGRLTAGDYARCLLRAVQPLAAQRTGYCPAAMAADPSHVERRIEMILDSTPRPIGRWIKIGAVALLAGWGVFALTGAAARGPQAAPPAPPCEPEAHTFVFVQAGESPDGSAATHQLCVEKFAFSDEAPAGLADVLVPAPMMFVGTASGDQPGGTFTFTGTTAPSERMMARFLTAHPTADANGDGVLTAAERDAFLVARALAEPAAVLAKFPKADLNGDGTLSTDEAARLVTLPTIEAAPSPGRFRTMVLGGGPDAGACETVKVIAHAAAGGTMPAHVIKMVHGDATTTAATAGEAAATINVDVDATPTQSGERRVRIVKKIDDGSGERVIEEERVIKGDTFWTTAAPTPGNAGCATANATAAPFDLPIPPDVADMLPASLWLARKLTAEPAATEVARYTALVAELPLAHFLKQHPEADSNGDGTLTPVERDAFVEAQTVRMRQRLLERHPEADLNGDGVLSPDEMSGVWRAKLHEQLGGGASGQRVIIRRAADGTGGPEQEIVIEAGAASGQIDR